MSVLASAKHERFAQLIAKGKTADDAYAEAGYKPDRAHASRLAANGNIQARVTELLEKGAEKAAITIADVLSELGKIAFSNMLDYVRVGADGDAYVDLSAVSRDQAAAIGEITVEDFKDGRGEGARDVRRVKFKLNDKKGALVDIGRHLGMFPNKVELTGADGGPLQHVVDRPPNETRAEWMARRALELIAEKELGHVGSAAGPAD